MYGNDKYQEWESRPKYPIAVSIAAHAVLFLLLNYAALNIFKPGEKKPVYIQLEIITPPEQTPIVSNGAQIPGEQINPQTRIPGVQSPVIDLPEITNDPDIDEPVIKELPKEDEPGNLPGKKYSYTIPPGADTIKTIAELKILIAEDIKKNYGKTDQEIIRKVWQKYLKERSDYLIINSSPGIPLDDIFSLFGSPDDSLKQIADTLTGLRK